MYVFFHLQVVEIPGVKSKVKNRLVEWLRERVVRGSQKALAIKNGTVSLLLLLLLIVNDYCKKKHQFTTPFKNDIHQLSTSKTANVTKDSFCSTSPNVTVLWSNIIFRDIWTWSFSVRKTLGQQSLPPEESRSPWKGTDNCTIESKVTSEPLKQLQGSNWSFVFKTPKGTSSRKKRHHLTYWP